MKTTNYPLGREESHPNSHTDRSRRTDTQTKPRNQYKQRFYSAARE